MEILVVLKQQVFPFFYQLTKQKELIRIHIDLIIHIKSQQSLHPTTKQRERVPTNNLQTQNKTQKQGNQPLSTG